MRDASAIRKAYSDANEEKEVEILQDLYGKNWKLIKPIFDTHLPLRESLIRFIKSEASPSQKLKYKKIVHEAYNKINKTKVNDYLEEK